MGRKAGGIAAAVSVLSALLFAPPAFASNGLNMIGFGTESLTMGGADLAVARDTSALNTNPAGLMQISGRQVDFYSAMAFALDIRHRDRFGNDQEIANSRVGLGDLGYAQRLASRPIAFGIGLFAQGGAGYNYGELRTAFGTQDELSSFYRIAKLTTGGALQVSPAVSLGASLALFYADLNQKVFPDTSFFNSGAPSQSFFGFELQDMKAMNVGYKLGVMFKASDRITVGMAYTSKVKLDLDDGRLISNLSDLGLGKVTYGDVQVNGLNLPQELGVGIAIRPIGRLLASVELNWVDWSSALKSSTLNASEPDRSGAPPVQAFTAKMAWRDQVVMAVGIAYELEKAVFRAGYNFGRNPIPPETLNPLLATVQQHTVTVGAGYRVTARWSMDGGVEYVLRETIRYTNPELPFGPDAEAVVEVIVIHFTASYHF